MTVFIKNYRFARASIWINKFNKNRNQILSLNLNLIRNKSKWKKAIIAIKVTTVINQANKLVLEIWALL